MGYIINSQGEKLKVDNPSGYCTENVVLVNDNTILATKYSIDLFQKNIYDDNESKFVKEIILDDKPTDEEIIFYMTQNGINRYSGFAIVEEIKVLDFKEE